MRLFGRMAERVFEVIPVPVLAGLTGEVDVRIDEARQQRRVAEVDDLRVRRNGDAGAGGDDAIAVDDDHAIRQHVVGCGIEDMCGLQRDRFRGLRESDGGGERDEESERQLFHVGEV